VSNGLYSIKFSLVCITNNVGITLFAPSLNFSIRTSYSHFRESSRPRYRQRSFPKLDGGLGAIQLGRLCSTSLAAGHRPVPKKETPVGPPRRRKEARKNLRDPREITDSTVYRSTDDKSSNGIFAVPGRGRILSRLRGEREKICGISRREIVLS